MQLRGIDNIYKNTTGPHYVLIHESEKAHVETLNLPSVDVVTFPDFGEPLETLLQEISEVASQVTNAESSGGGNSSTPKKPFYSPNNPVFYVPFRQKGDQVIGREEALKQVREQLTEGRRTAIGHAAAFRGLGGLGKTQLAVEYAYCFKDKYPNGVIWLNADQDIAAQLTDLAEKAKWVAPESDTNTNLKSLRIAFERIRIV